MRIYEGLSVMLVQNTRQESVKIRVRRSCSCSGASHGRRIQVALRVCRVVPNSAICNIQVSQKSHLGTKVR